MLNVLTNINFELLVLVGDIYQIESITFGNTFLTISQQSFQYCNSLKKISFPQNLDNIGNINL